jgi:hypothetical protein
MLALLKDIFEAMTSFSGEEDYLDLISSDIENVAVLLRKVVDAARVPGLEAAAGDVMVAFQNAGFSYGDDGTEIEEQLLGWECIKAGADRGGAHVHNTI